MPDREEEWELTRAGHATTNQHLTVVDVRLKTQLFTSLFRNRHRISRQHLDSISTHLSISHPSHFALFDGGLAEIYARCAQIRYSP